MFDPSAAVAEIDHPHLALVAGRTAFHEAEPAAGTRSNWRTRHVSHFTEVIGGVECRRVIERGFVDEKLIDERNEYLAEDAAGNVWILAVAAAQFDDAGAVTGRQGSFRFTEPGVRAGLLLPAAPQLGDSFERMEGERGWVCVIAATDASVHANALGTFEDCLALQETQHVPGAGVRVERYLAPGFGEVASLRDGSSTSLAALLDDAAPIIDPAQFVADVGHPFLPMIPGVTIRYRGFDEDGTIDLEWRVLQERRRIVGVDCTTVQSLEHVNGELVEEALDWFAQDRAGNVWYFGSAVTEYEEAGGATLVSAESWIAGELGATPGLEMPALPRIGDSFRQENAPGVAEDLAMVNAFDTAVETPLGRFTGCIELLERNGLEPDSANEHKSYAPGIGMVLEQDADGSEWLGIVEIRFHRDPQVSHPDRRIGSPPPAPGAPTRR